MEIVPLLLELSDVQTSRPCARVYLIVRRARNLNLGQNQRNVDQFAPNSARMKKAPQAAKAGAHQLCYYLPFPFQLMMT
jgi:hypothetical protein